MNGIIYLVGFMASGKTTLGRALAERIGGSRFIDLDQAVEAAAGMPVRDIFAGPGEDYFRRCESETLRAVSLPGSIIACGGGTPCHGDNMDFMLATGRVVWLVADENVTARRLRLAPGQRPLVDRLLSDSGALRRHIRSLADSRRPHYSRAHVVFDSNRLEDERQIEESCHKFISTILAPQKEQAWTLPYH